MSASADDRHGCSRRAKPAFVETGDEFYSRSRWVLPPIASLGAMIANPLAERCRLYSCELHAVSLIVQREDRAHCRGYFDGLQRGDPAVDRGEGGVGGVPAGDDAHE